MKNNKIQIIANEIYNRNIKELNELTENKYSHINNKDFKEHQLNLIKKRLVSYESKGMNILSLI